MKERGAGGSLKGQAGADQVRQAGGIGSAGRENNAKAECETTLGSDDQGDQSILGGGARAGGGARGSLEAAALPGVKCVRDVGPCPIPRYYKPCCWVSW